MPQACTVCTNPRRAEIDAALTAGESLRAVAQQFSVSKDSLARHQRHQSAATATPASAPPSDTPAPTPAAAPSLLETRLAVFAEALRALETCDAESIEQHYRAAIPPLHALAAGMVDESLSRIHAREAQRVTSAWDREGLRVKFGGWLQSQWRKALAEALSR